jgi:hypothetical protein
VLGVDGDGRSGRSTTSPTTSGYVLAPVLDDDPISGERSRSRILSAAELGTQQAQ